MASAKRELPFSDEPLSKKVKVPESASNSSSNPRVTLNPADCDIDFNVEGNGLQGSALCEDGFAYCWSGARANMGITGGKYCFGCKIISAQSVEMADTPVDQQHLCRIGISRGDDAVRNLGETVHSFGFGSTGRFSNSGNFIAYGERFGVGDTIVCAVNLENNHVADIGFFKNGKWLGVGKHFDAGPNGLGVVGSSIRNLQWESALFPHVLLKNVVVQLQFSIDDGLVPPEGYQPWSAAIIYGNSVLGPGFQNLHDCEVIMMVGLPASGKTTWAEKLVKEHPEKRYVLLGTNLALEQMKVPGLLRKHNYGERFERLMDHATKIFNVLLSRASRLPRNFIIDQTNVYKSARKRKLKPFSYYVKIAAVVFPKPEDLKLRADKRFKEMGKEVPAEAVKEMLANFSLPMSMDMPRTDEYFDRVLFVELSREESQRFLDEMKREKNFDLFLPSISREKTLSMCSSTLLQHLQSSPNLSGTGLLLENQGGHGHHLVQYPSQSLAGGTHESYHSNLPNHGSWHNFDYIRDFSRQTGYADCFTNAESGHISHEMVDPTPGTVADSYPRTSLFYNSCDGGYPSESGGAPYNQFPTGNHIFQSAAPFPYGLYGTQIPRPPHGSLPTDMQQPGAYSQLLPTTPPSANNLLRPGVYPPPRSGY